MEVIRERYLWASERFYTINEYDRNNVAEQDKQSGCDCVITKGSIAL